MKNCPQKDPYEKVKPQGLIVYYEFFKSCHGIYPKIGSNVFHTLQNIIMVKLGNPMFAWQLEIQKG